jgi:hypothetical protein
MSDNTGNARGKSGSFVKLPSVKKSGSHQVKDAGVVGKSRGNAKEYFRPSITPENPGRMYEEVA